MIAVRYALLLLALLAHALSKHTNGLDYDRCVTAVYGVTTPYIVRNKNMVFYSRSFSLQLPKVPNCDKGSFVTVCVNDRFDPEVKYITRTRVSVQRHGAVGEALVSSGEYCPYGAHPGALGHTRLPAPQVTLLNDRN